MGSRMASILIEVVKECGVARKMVEFNDREMLYEWTARSQMTD